MNPLVARTLKWMDRPFRNAIIAAVGVLASVILLTPLAYAAADIYLMWITMLGAVIVLMPTFFAITAAHFTERTIHEGFYDMVVMSMTDREIVLGHVLLAFLHRRNSSAGIISLLLTMVVLIPLFAINQSDVDDSGIHTMIGALALIVGAGGLYLLAAAVGVAVSLNRSNRLIVFGLAVLSYLLLSLVCVWLALNSFEAVAMGVNPVGDAPMGLVVGSFYLIVMMVTWGYEHTVTNSVRILAAYLSMTLMILVIGEALLLGTLIAVMLVSGFMLMTMDHDPSDGISPFNRSISMFPQLGVMGITLALLITLLVDSNSRDYTLSIVGLTGVMVLPYVLAVGVMKLAETWTERPIAQHYSS
jgi:hypothetical protein